jgi:acetyl-CoA C-acetyltransferase
MRPRYERSAYLCAPVRTPIGKFGGALVDWSAADLGAHAARAVIERAGIDPSEIDLTIMGNGRQAGVGPNVARQISHRAGVPDSVPAWTINQACASSLVGILQAWQAIALGDADIVLAGGTESMSNTPYLLPRARWGYRLGHGELVDGMYRDGFLCPLCGELMGATAETLADRYEIPRAEQDAYAVESQRRYEAARAAGRWADEVAPFPDGLEADEHPRPGPTVEKLSRLAPVFRDAGTVHAGNASGIPDGAAALIVASGDAVDRLGLTPFARLVDWANEGVDPAIMGIGPVPAVRQVLERQKLAIGDLDLIELNEAFAAQVLSVTREWGFKDNDFDRLNVNGSGISIGHPIGATGGRILATLLHEMERRDARYGLETMCIGGGQGIAAVFERA